MSSPRDRSFAHSACAAGRHLHPAERALPCAPRVTCPSAGLTIESVFQLPREDSEVPRSRRGLFRPGRPRFCPAGGRTPAALPQPVREYAAARASAPGPRLSRLSFLGRSCCPSRGGRGLGGSLLYPRSSGGAPGEAEGRGDPGLAEGRGAPLEHTGLPEGASSGRSNGRGQVGVPRAQRNAPLSCFSTLHAVSGGRGIGKISALKSPPHPHSPPLCRAPVAVNFGPGT